MTQPSSQSSEPTILKSVTGADFLATLPALAGYTAKRSLLVVPFLAKRTMGVIRVDLPQHDAEDDHAKIGSLVIGMLSRLRDCDGAALVMYVDETFPVAFLAWDALRLHLDERLEDAGFAIKDAFCVAPDGWASWYEPNAPDDGHPLAEIAESPLAAKAAEIAREDDLHDFEADASLPDPDPTLQKLLTAAVVDLVEYGIERTPLGLDEPAKRPDGVEFVEKLLAVEPDSATVPMLAHLIDFCGTPAARDQLTVQIAFGVKIGRKAAKFNARMHALQAKTGLSMDELVEREMKAGRLPSEPMTELLLGDTNRIPSAARMKHAIAVLRRAIANVDPVDRPGPLCVLAWLYWGLGRSSIANRVILDALAIDPSHGMAQLYAALLQSGKLPEWVFTGRNPYS